MTLPFYYQQTDYTCGAACMRMLLAAKGIKKSETQLARQLKTSKRSGTWAHQFPQVAEKYRLTYIVVRKGTIKELKELSKGGYCILVCYFIKEEDTGHYALVKSITKTHITLFDPWYGPDQRFTLKKFTKIWKNDEEKQWFFAIKLKETKNMKNKRSYI